MAKKRKIIDLEVQEVSLVSSPANPPAKVTLIKSESKKPVVKGGQSCRLCATGVDAEDHYCKGCGAPFYKAAPEQGEKMETKVTPGEPVEKSEKPVTTVTIDAEVLTKSNEALKKAATEIEELKKSLATERRVRKVNDRKVEVEKTMKSVPATVDELAENLVKLADLDEELAKFFGGLLEKANGLIETGLAQKSTGRDAVSSVTAQYEALLAKKRAEKPSISKEAAAAEVWLENPDLISAERESKRK